MKRILIFICSLLPLLLFTCNSSKNVSSSTSKPITSSGLFVSSETLTNVLDEAQSIDKIVFVDMYTTWCVPCKVMDDEVYTDPSVLDFLKEHMISYKVDAEKGNGPDLTIIYNVQVYPTLLFLDDKGREIVRSDGALSTTGFLELARKAVEMVHLR